jgi:hypothetical protein
MIQLPIHAIHTQENSIHVNEKKPTHKNHILFFLQIVLNCHEIFQSSQKKQENKPHA